MAGSPADPVPEFEWTTTNKIISLSMNFMSRTVLDVPQIEVRYANGPQPEGGPPMLKLELLNAGWSPFAQVKAWNPLLVLGTLDPEIGLPHGPAVWLDEVMTEIPVRFSPYLAFIRISDLELGQTLATIDVRPAIRKFCAEHTEDEDCKLIAEQLGFVFVPVIRRP